MGIEIVKGGRYIKADGSGRMYGVKVVDISENGKYVGIKSEAVLDLFSNGIRFVPIEDFRYNIIDKIQD